MVSDKYFTEVKHFSAVAEMEAYMAAGGGYRDVLGKEEMTVLKVIHYEDLSEEMKKIYEIF